MGANGMVDDDALRKRKAPKPRSISVAASSVVNAAGVLCMTDTHHVGPEPSIATCLRSSGPVDCHSDSASAQEGVGAARASTANFGGSNDSSTDVRCSACN